MHTGAGTSRRRAYREMTIAGVLWGTIGPAAAIVDEHTSPSPLQTSFWRLIIAVVPLAVLAILAARATARPPQTLLLVALALGALTGASQLAYFAALAAGVRAVVWGVASILPEQCVELHRLLIDDIDLPAARDLWAAR